MSETSTQAPAFTLAALSVDAGAETNRIAALERRRRNSATRPAVAAH